MPVSLLDFLFPRCSLLGGEGDWVSPSELQSLIPHSIVLDQKYLRTIGMPSIDRLIAMERYHHAPLLRRAIHLWKYRGVRALDKPLAGLLCKGMRKVTISPEAVLCPIPLFWVRHFDRGFNQSSVLAEALAQEKALTVRPLLRRRISTGHQAHRTGAERRSAMSSAFCIREVPPRHVVLIDDVCTTGSTLESAACELRRNGVQCIEAVVLALD